MGTTANYGWNKPEDGDGQANGKPWGVKFRAFLDDLDTKIFLALNYLAPWGGAILRTITSKLSDHVSVKDFGAVGDGVTDDTAAIQAAIDSGASRIIYPRGTYKVTGAVLGSFQSHIGDGATLTSSGTIFTLPAGATQYITFDGLVFAGSGNAIYTTGIYLNSGWVIRNCQFGRTLSECVYAPLILSKIEDNLFGKNNGSSGSQHRHLYLSATAASGTAINCNIIKGNRFNFATGVGASTFIQYGSGNKFIGNDWESNSCRAVHINGGGTTNFHSNWFESNTATQQIYLEATADITATIYYNNVINFVGNNCNLLSSGNAALFYLDANSYKLSMVGNLLYTNQSGVVVTNTPAGDNSGIVEFRNNANYGNSFTITGIPSFSADIVFARHVNAGGSSTASGTVVAKAIGSNNPLVAVNASDAVLFYVNYTGQVSTGTAASSPYNSTTATAANLVVLSNGVIQRSTSAAKYKTDIRDLESVDLGKLRAVRYKSICEGDDPTQDHFGLVADEVDAAGFKELVTYGSDGQIEGLQYERLTALLLRGVQDLKAEFEVYRESHP